MPHLVAPMRMRSEGIEANARAHPLLGSYDAACTSIHVATAEVLLEEAAGEPLEFWTHDARQATAALSRGLSVRGV